MGPSAAAIPVLPIGCALVYDDGACVPLPGVPLRLWIDAPTYELPAVTGSRGRRLRVHRIEPNATTLVEIEIDSDEPLSKETLHVYVKVDGHVRKGSVKLRGLPEEPPWLTTAWQVRNDATGGGQKAWQILADHAAEIPKLTDAALARYRSLDGRLRLELDKPDWEAKLRLAITANQKAGLLSNQAEDVFWLSENLIRRAGRLADAEQLLVQNRAALDRLPDALPWVTRQEALHRQTAGDLRGALDYLEKGRQRARVSGDVGALADLNVIGAALLSKFGRLEQANQWLGELEMTKLSACRRSEVRFAKVQIYFQQWESTFGSPPPEVRGIPGQLMSEVLGQQEFCDQLRNVAEANTYLARAAVQRGEFRTAEDLVVKARLAVRQRNTSEVDYELEPILQYTEAEIARGQKQWTVARQHFYELQKLGRDYAIADAEWQALIGFAQVAEADPAGSVDAKILYEAAEKRADRDSVTTLLGLSGGGYLSRYERGTALYVDLLLRRNELAVALQVIRHARVRGIRVLAVLDRLPQQLQKADQLPQLNKVEQARYRAALVTYQQARETALSKYRQSRVAVERHEQLKQDAPGDMQPILQAEHESLVDQALRQLEAVLKLGDLDALADVPQRPPGADELLLTCHPTKTRWVCLAADSVATKYSYVESRDLDRRLSPSVLTAKLLTPFHEQLQRAKRLNVLGYGALREIDFGMLPFGPAAAPLFTQRAVVYGLDLPPTATPAAAAPPLGTGVVVLVFDPEGHLAKIKDTAPVIIKSAQTLGYQVHVPGFVVTQAGTLQRGAAELTREQLLTELGQAQLFHAALHIDYAKTGGWRHLLRLSAEAGIMVSDILALPKVPSYVTLFACESGVTREESGNLEGLGMAQAFLARGSQWVVGTSRQIKPELAAAMSSDFYQALVQSHDPVAALRAAIENHRASADSDVWAFRVYVP